MQKSKAIDLLWDELQENLACRISDDGDYVSSTFDVEMIDALFELCKVGSSKFDRYRLTIIVDMLSTTKVREDDPTYGFDLSDVRRALKALKRRVAKFADRCGVTHELS